MTVFFVQVVVIRGAHTDFYVCFLFIIGWGRLAISTEKEQGQLVQRWLSNQGGLFPHHYYYYIGVALVFVIVLMFYKF